MGFSLNEDRLVTPLQYVTKALVVTIEPLREDSVQKLHSACQVGLRGLDEDVCSVATLCVAWANCVRLPGQTVGMTDPPKPTDYLSKGI